MWATKNNNIKEDIGDVNKKSLSIVLEKVDLEIFSCEGLEIDRIHTDLKPSTDSLCRSLISSEKN